MIERQEIFDWVEAEDAQDRTELVRTAIGVALLEHYERTSTELELATDGLIRLGVLEAPEPDIPEVYIDRLEYEDLTFGVRRQPVINAGTRLWNALKRYHPEVFHDELPLMISINKLAELVKNNNLESMPGVGDTCTKLAQKIIDKKLPQPDKAD